MADNKNVSKGLGDTVAKVIAITSLGSFVPKKGCGCAKRQEALNKLFPYNNKNKADIK